MAFPSKRDTYFLPAQQRFRKQVNVNSFLKCTPYVCIWRCEISWIGRGSVTKALREILAAGTMGEVANFVGKDLLSRHISQAVVLQRFLYSVTWRQRYSALSAYVRPRRSKVQCCHVHIYAGLHKLDLAFDSPWKTSANLCKLQIARIPVTVIRACLHFDQPSN
jgi:hypothetical protein